MSDRNALLVARIRVVPRRPRSLAPQCVRVSLASRSCCRRRISWCSGGPPVIEEAWLLGLFFCRGKEMSKFSPLALMLDAPSTRRPHEQFRSCASVSHSQFPVTAIKCSSSRWLCRRIARLARLSPPDAFDPASFLFPIARAFLSKNSFCLAAAKFLSYPSGHACGSCSLCRETDGPCRAPDAESVLPLGDQVSCRICNCALRSISLPRCQKALSSDRCCCCCRLCPSCLIASGVLGLVALR